MPSLLELSMMQRMPQLLGGMGGAPLPGQDGPRPPAPAQMAPPPASLMQGVQQGPRAPAQAQMAPQPPGPEQIEQIVRAEQKQASLSQIFRQMSYPEPDQRTSGIDAKAMMLNAGMALLGGGGQVSMGQALAAGLMAGRQAAAQNDAQRQAEIAAQQRGQRYLTSFGDGPMTRDKIDRAIQVATVSGDVETMKVLKDLRDQYPDDPSAARKMLELKSGKVVTYDEFGDFYSPDGTKLDNDELDARGAVPKDSKAFAIDGVIYYADEATRKTYNTQGGEVSPEEMMAIAERARPGQLDLRDYVDENGNRVQAAWDKRTGKMVPGTAKKTYNRDEMLTSTDIFDRAAVIRDDMRSDLSVLQDTLSIANSAFDMSNDSAGDSALITAFNKMLDRGSVVREGEYNRALTFGGYSSKVEKWANMFVDGRMPDEVRQQILGAMEVLRKAAQEDLNSAQQYYVETGEKFNVSADLVLKPADLAAYRARQAAAAQQAQSPPASIAAPAGGGGQTFDVSGFQSMGRTSGG